MKSRRAGHGITSGVRTAPARAQRHDSGAPANGPAHSRTTLGDDPRIAAALEYARADVEAYEQTEAAWRAVWGVSDP